MRQSSREGASSFESSASDSLTSTTSRQTPKESAMKIFTPSSFESSASDSLTSTTSRQTPKESAMKIFTPITHGATRVLLALLLDTVAAHAQQPQTKTPDAPAPSAAKPATAPAI